MQSINPEGIIVIFDNLNILMNSCYSKNELDFLEIFNEILAITENNESVSVAVSINRDLFDEDNDIALTYYRDMKNTVFD